MKTKDTIKILEQQLDEAPHSPQLWEDLADLYLQREQVDKAIDAYEFALAIEPDRESALCKRSIAYLATDNPALHQKGKTYLETYSRQHPEQTELRDMLDRLNRLVDESIPSFLPSDDKETQGYALVDVAKGRNTGVFSFLCAFDAPTTHFTDVRPQDVPTAGLRQSNEKDMPF